MTRREQALYLLAGKISPGLPFFRVAAQALAVRTGCRWAGIGELSEAGDSVKLLAFWDSDHQAEPFGFQLHGTPCLEVYRSRPEDPHNAGGRALPEGAGRSRGHREERACA